MTENPNRQAIVRRLREDLVGPLHPDELLEDRPSDRYLTGILYPMKSEQSPEDQEALSLGGEETGDTAEEAAPPERSQRHASAGLSFAVRSSGDRPSITIDVSAARYVPRWIAEDGEELAVQQEQKPPKWRREPIEIVLKEIEIHEGTSDSISLAEWGEPFLELRLHVAPIEMGSRAFAVTVVLLNGNEDDPELSRLEREQNLFFQTSVRIRPGMGTEIIARPSRRSGEDLDLQLIYRDAREYSVGHICSSRWEKSGERITEVATEWLPQSVVKAVSARGDRSLSILTTSDPLAPLSAAWLSKASGDQLSAALELLPSTYESWLKEQEQRIRSGAGVPEELQEQAYRHLGDGQQALGRMRRAIALLDSDDLVREAFQLANEAMVLQRRWARNGEQLDWRPFQLGFQLVALESIARKESDCREVMDLLWFPTGGGKTEAYLGLIAFALFLRRLTKQDPDNGAGCSVIMRYTLRLLTIQQFQRASSLILACEYLRRSAARERNGKGRLGEKEFSIGLWVGGGATPNDVSTAAERIATDQDPTPRQLTKCPVCQGSTLVFQPVFEKNRKGAQVPRRIQCRCTNGDCVLKGNLPIWTVDEDIYREIPSLVIGTVDKFAQIVRKTETKKFFGVSSDPPDLIIQDELHLISGPLGTMTGLYETAIDELCTRDVSIGGNSFRVRPKIIGSTATIRRAAEQVRQLFDRSVAQFPPPILDAGNSFFAVRDETAADRLYVGVTSAGRSPKFTLQAVCGSLLQAVYGESAGNPAPWDPWWTLVAYFNSLRELGGALVMMYDDVPASIGLFSRLRGEDAREVRNIDELTSRKKQSELRDTLADLDVKCGQEAAIDAVLATNMISVGVDVPRLGAMVVNGQPKQIAEYIQATSRVGRSHPGLVVSVYNNGKVRDRSHFETFSTWHGALYRDVEPTSVTPFAARAQDRGLHAILAAMSRLLLPGLGDAPKLSSTLRERVENEILPSIEARVASIDPQELPGVKKRLRQLLDIWEERAEEWASDKDLRSPEWWSDSKPQKALLLSAEAHATQAAAGIPNAQAWATPNSMREVEPGTPFKLIERIRTKDTPNDR
jgi:hypothetical protein